METFYDKLIMGTLTEIFIILRNIVFFWIIVGLTATGVYCTVRLISYAIYKSKLQVYFNLNKEEEVTNGQEEQERQKEIIIKKQGQEKVSRRQT